MMQALHRLRGPAHFLQNNQKFQQPWQSSLVGVSSSYVRRLWGFSSNEDDPKNKNNSDRLNEQSEEPSNSNGNDGIEKKAENSLVFPHGDHAPIISPLIILPTNRRPVFPGCSNFISVRDKATIDALKNSKPPYYVGAFYRKEPILPPSDRALDVITHIDEIHKIGTFGQMEHFIANADGSFTIGMVGHRRITLRSITHYGPPTIAEVTHWRKAVLPSPSERVRALLHEINRVLNEMVQTGLLVPYATKINQYNLPADLHRFCDVIAGSVLFPEGSELQKILEMIDIEEKLNAIYLQIVRDREVLKIQNDISRQIDEKMKKQHTEYILREQLKLIKKELGIEKDDKDELMNKYNAQLKEIEDRHKAALASSSSASSSNGETSSSISYAITVIKDEMLKLQSLEKNSGEFNVTRGYLDWLFAIPWGSVTQDTLNLEKAKVILDEDHYGLEEIKSRILEFIAVGKLKGSVTGKIICFVGPPGVGKTSIGKSIARALDRKFYRFSVGGLVETSEIKGHRRTYVGAMPGKPIQCLKITKSMNPLILIDEIDKLARSYNGDPASALLELLDPNQNSSFLDHYLDVPVDFSNVLFVCTANDESTIPGPLKDRMEVIRLSGYDTQEKVAIATRYLVPKALKEAGLVKEKSHQHVETSTDKQSSPEVVPASEVPQVSAPAEATPADKVPENVSESNVEPVAHAPTYSITDDALEYLTKKYCRESGVRSLEKTIEKLVRKLAYERVQSQEKEVSSEGSKQSPPASPTEEPAHVIIKKEDLEKYIGKPIFQDDTIYEDSHHGLPIGVVLGLAWNPYGGSPIFIETVAVACAPSERDSGVHMVTGQLGAVMKESVDIAYTYARRFILSRDSSNKFFHGHQIHLHVPEGAISKDGPSAGIAMATSFVSVALQIPLRPNIAMTGEISLTGKVLPVGGIKEKTLAAKRSGAKIVILPFTNRRDYDELPDYVKADIEVHFVKDYQEVFNIVFPDLATSKQ